MRKFFGQGILVLGLFVIALLDRAQGTLTLTLLAICWLAHAYRSSILLTTIVLLAADVILGTFFGLSLLIYGIAKVIVVVSAIRMRLLLRGMMLGILAIVSWWIVPPREVPLYLVCVSLFGFFVFYRLSHDRLSIIDFS